MAADQPYFAANLPTNATYAVIALSLVVPLRAAHASYLARPLKSSMPGRLPCTSPELRLLVERVELEQLVVRRGFRELLHAGLGCGKVFG